MKNKYRKCVPKCLKDALWDKTFGEEAGQGNCYVCNSIINSKRFEAGHIISVYNGGGTNLNNLKCICSTCNKSMGTRNLEVFKKIYFPNLTSKNSISDYFKMKRREEKEFKELQNEFDLILNNESVIDDYDDNDDDDDDDDDGNKYLILQKIENLNKFKFILR